MVPLLTGFLKFLKMENGVLFVTTYGVTTMRLSSVKNWDFNPMRPFSLHIHTSRAPPRTFGTMM